MKKSNYLFLFMSLFVVSSFSFGASAREKFTVLKNGTAEYCRIVGQPYLLITPPKGTELMDPALLPLSSLDYEYPWIQDLKIYQKPIRVDFRLSLDGSANGTISDIRLVGKIYKIVEKRTEPSNTYGFIEHVFFPKGRRGLYFKLVAANFLAKVGDSVSFRIESKEGRVWASRLTRVTVSK